MSTTPEQLRGIGLMRKLGLEPDPWQMDVLEGAYSRLLLNCSRQAGKSTAVAMLGLTQAIWVPFTKVLLLSRTFRQSSELFRIVLDFHRRIGSPLLERRNSHELQLSNMSRIFCLPCKEETIRGYSNISLLIIDEAARVPDDLFRAVSPMLAVSEGRMICLSTPHGKRGYFYQAWAQGGADWTRIQVPASQVPRIKKDFLDRERRTFGEASFRQEYDCSFESVEGLVYPDFARCVVPGPAPQGRHFGGIDFGYRNPFAAVWGILDRDDILWLTGEHFTREKLLAHHVQHLPRQVTWYADPESPREIAEFRCAGLAVRKADNAVEFGITAVRARLEDGSLRILQGACPNLLAEAGLYRYGTKKDGEDPEKPVKENDHAMDALRYLVSRIDATRMARLRHRPSPTPPMDPQPETTTAQPALPAAGAGLPTPPPAPGTDPPAQPPAPAPGAGLPTPPPAPPARKPPRKWLSIWNEQLWTRL